MAGDHREETNTCSDKGIATFVVGLVSGTFSALICKMAYDTSSVGLDGTTKLFAKPIMMLFLMFAAMVPAIFFWLIKQFFAKENERETVTYKTMAILIVPCLCDLLCTLLLLIAQLYITASLWQMMRGSIIIITALLKKFALGHRLKRHMWLGVSVITLAMLLVASTSFFEPSTDSNPSGKDPRIGILLVLIGCLAQGVQYVFEEKVMAVDNAPPLVVIGCEGLWGTVLTIILVYPMAYLMPGSDNGHFEDPFDALHMIMSSPTLKTLVVLFVVTVTTYNCMVVYVTKYLSAIWHAILDNFRPITIWALDLAIFYVIFPGTGFGEQWTSASWLQLAGLFILLFGTAIYNGSIVTFDDMKNGEYTPIKSSITPTESETEMVSTQAIPIGGATELVSTESLMKSPTLSRSLEMRQNKMNTSLAAASRKPVSSEYKAILAKYQESNV